MASLKHLRSFLVIEFFQLKLTQEEGGSGTVGGDHKHRDR